MKFRDRLKRKAIETKDLFIWNQFRLKNQVNWEIDSSIKAYYENHMFIARSEDIYVFENDRHVSM